MSVEVYPVKIIGHIRTDFTSKFGVPRQSGIVDALEARIEFEKEFAQPEAFRGLEGFSHLWIIWQFSEAVRSNWSATVRPPRLGGNTRVGVFATRSPFRPNAIGLSSVKIGYAERPCDLCKRRRPDGRDSDFGYQTLSGVCGFSSGCGGRIRRAGELSESPGCVP